jgi:hypothetical protein
MYKYIKFIGDFKILKSMGFKFGKYYGRNHKAYSMRCKDYEHLNDMHIWVLGRDVTIGSMSTIQSFYLAKHIITGTYQVYEEDLLKILPTGEQIVVFEAGDSKDNMINKNTGEIMEHIELLRRYGVLKALKDRVPSNKIPNPGKDGWNEVHLTKEAISLVKEFHEKGLIEFVEN